MDHFGENKGTNGAINMEQVIIFLIKKAYPHVT